MNDSKVVTLLLNQVGDALRRARSSALAEGDPAAQAPLYIVALSGGADSVALLSALCRLGVRVQAAHCNFHLRGEESDRDTLFVRALCKRLHVPLNVADFQAEKLAREQHKGIEVMCRDLRYEWFEELCSRYDAFRLVVAHHAGDQAETVMLNLMRGSGSGGLRGMLPDDGHVLRPLLGVTRRDIEEYLKAVGEDYVTDSTNADQVYRRNYLRHTVLPNLAAQWPGAEQVLNRVADTMRREHKIVMHSVRTALAEAARLAGDNTVIPWKVYLDYPDAATLVYYFLMPLGVGSDRAAKVAKEVARSAPRPDTGKRWRLGDSLTLLATRRGLSIISE